MPSGHSHAKPHISRSDALELWYDVTLDNVRGNMPDLSARQMAVLMTVYLRPAPHTVRSLAAHLNVTKAVITRALNTLGQHGFVTRARDPRDKRSVLIARTGRGSSYLTSFADKVRAQTKQHLSAESLDEIEVQPSPTQFMDMMQRDLVQRPEKGLTRKVLASELR